MRLPAGAWITLNMALKAVIEFISHKSSLEAGIGQFVNRAVEKSIKVAERNVKANTPVKHGYLRRSIASDMTGFGKGEIFTNPIGSVAKKTASKKGISQHKEVSYAVYVEYGTKYMAPRAMFRKGLGQSQKQIKQIFRDEARKVKDADTGK